MLGRFMALAALAATPILASADRVDDLMRSTVRNVPLPGAILIVSHQGRPVRISTYGYSNLEAKTPVRRDSVFEIGSVSKQFTAAAVLLLVEEGKVGLDDPVGKHLPSAPEKWRPLTLRQILSHTSGLKDTLQTLDDPKFRAEEYFTKMGPLAFDFEPGTSWSYSNMGFNLAAAVVAEVAKEPFPTFVEKRIFKKLGMEHTSFTTPSNVVANRVRGYVWTGKSLSNVSATYPATAIGAGAIMSTGDDLVRWNWALLSGKFLNAESRREFFAPTHLKDGTTVPYGLGWMTTQDQNRPLWEHGGNTMGFSCSNMLLPNEKASITVLTNSAGFPGGVLTRTLAAELYPQYDLGKRAATPDPAPESTSKLMMTLRKFAKNNFKELEIFTPSARGQLSSFRGAMERLGYAAIGKDLKTYRHLDSENLADGRRLSRYALRVGEAATLFVQVTWSKEGLANNVGTLYSQANPELIRPKPLNTSSKK